MHAPFSRSPTLQMTRLRAQSTAPALTLAHVLHTHGPAGVWPEERQPGSQRAGGGGGRRHRRAFIHGWVGGWVLSYMGGWVGGCLWVGGWVGGCFHTGVGGWVGAGGWVGGWVGGCFHPWVGGGRLWVGAYVASSRQAHSPPPLPPPHAPPHTPTSHPQWTWTRWLPLRRCWRRWRPPHRAWRASCSRRDRAHGGGARMGGGARVCACSLSRCVRVLACRPPPRHTSCRPACGRWAREGAPVPPLAPPPPPPTPTHSPTHPPHPLTVKSHACADGGAGGGVHRAGRAAHPRQGRSTDGLPCGAAPLAPVRVEGVGGGWVAVGGLLPSQRG